MALAKPKSFSASSACAGENSEGLLVAHENCNQFNQCNAGVPVVLNCPTGLMFNVISQLCDWPENVNCGGRPIVEGNGGNDSNENGNDSGNGDDNDSGNGDNGVWKPENGYDDPSQAPAICAAEGSDGVLVAHEICAHFYKCFEGRPVELGCPLSLKYNPKLESCDWPQNVDCAGRT